MDLYSAILLVALGVFIPLSESHHRSENILYVDRDRDGVEAVTEPAATCRKYKTRHLYGGEVCGSDGDTYPNGLYLSCINRHREKKYHIRAAYAGPCKNDVDERVEDFCEKNFLYKPVCGSDNQTYANVEALNCKNAMTPDYEVKLVRNGECEALKCPCQHADHSRVCASNGVTYRSLGEVRCLRRYNPGLHVLHSGGCNVREVRRSHSRRMACHMARNRYEWNPVCGQNNLTYANPYLYICHHPPNEGKCAAKPGECNSLRQLACVRANAINQKRLESSAVVCGSNGVTYRSYEHLHCATITDRYLEAVSTGRCTKVYDPCLQTVKPLLDRGNPVCASDDNTYVNIQALWCVKKLGKKGLRYKHDGPCL